jgi:hypothetical protein
MIMYKIHLLRYYDYVRNHKQSWYLDVAVIGKAQVERRKGGVLDRLLAYNDIESAGLVL